MAWPKVFARLIKTTTATDVDVNERYYAYPYSKEQEPRLREQRVLETRKWHDPTSQTLPIKTEQS